MAITAILLARLKDTANNTVNLAVGNEPTQRLLAAVPIAIPPRMIGCAIARAIGDLKRAKSEPQPMQITIDNNDGFLDQYLTGGSLNIPFWHGAECSLIVGGTTATELTTAAPYVAGHIVDGSWTMSEGIISFAVLPFLVEDVGTVGGLKMVSPNPDINGQKIPFRVGDFSTAELVNENALNCVWQGSATWRVNELPIAAPFRFYRKAAGGSVWVDVTASAVVNALAGTVDLSAVGGIAQGDAITAACKCAVGGGVSPVSFHPVDICQWLLTRLLLGSTAYIDLPTFAAAKINGEPITVRRDITSEQITSYEIERLAFETGYTLYITPQSKTAIKSALETSANVLTLDAGTIDFAENSFAVSGDPDRLYTNYIDATFNEYNDKNRETAEEINTAEIARYNGRTAKTNVSFAWQFDASAVQRQLQRYIFYWGQSPNVVELSLPFSDSADPRFNLEVLNIITLNYRNFKNAQMIVRGLALDFIAAANRARMYQIASFGLAAKWGMGGYLFADAAAGSPFILVVNGDKQLPPAGNRVYIGTDTNGGLGYTLTLTAPTGANISPNLATPQPRGAWVDIFPTGDQSAVVGKWGPPTDTVYI